MSHELKPLIEASENVENQGAIDDWFIKIRKGIRHALHLTVVVINRKITLVEIAELRVKE